VDWLRDNASLIIGLFGMIGVLWTGYVKLRGDDGTDEAKLRTDLMQTVTGLSTESRNLRTEITGMRAAHKADLEALETDYAKQITSLQTRLDTLDATNRRLNRQVSTMGQQIVEMQGAVKGLQDREYVYVAHYHELDKQGMLMYPYEWVRIKQAANRVMPMPLWPVTDALEQAREEGPSTDE
jgi:hypothetical protein